MLREPLGFTIGQKRPWPSSILILFGIFLVCVFALAALAQALVFLAFGIPQADQLSVINGNLEGVDPTTARLAILIIQGLSTGVAFALTPIIYTRFIERRSLRSFSPVNIKDNLQLLWAVLLIPAVMPLLELTISWNKTLDLPDTVPFLRQIEQWAQSTEQNAEELVKRMTAFGSLWEFAIGILVIAVLPAIGEELLFRGALQPVLFRATGSWHRAIWLSAFIFSAIHFQFYGFLPRMLLGALFGYLYVWSGNIAIPILAHFTNNGITLVLIYLNRRGSLAFNPDSLPPAPLPIILVSIFATAAVLYRFYQRYFQARLVEK
jgi:membrane protease YdiL (CAAX protease family)